MRCPVCDQVAPRGANFCFACGTSLARICPRCKAGQSPDARFCPECGGRLPPGPGEIPGEIPADATAVPSGSPPVADRRVGTRDDAADLLDDPSELEDERRRDSRRRLATAVGVLLFVLAALGWAALWMGLPSRPSLERFVGRSPETAPPAIVPATPAAPSPAPPPMATAAEPGSPPEGRALDGPEPRSTERVEPGTSEPQRREAETPARLAGELPERQRSESSARSVPVRSEVRPEARAGEPRPLPERPPAGPERRVVELPLAWQTPLDRESPAALPGPARGDVRVDVAAERAGGGTTIYTVRLRERDGRPVTGASVTIHGRRAGAPVETSLEPATEAGVYRAALRAGDLTGPRLRVASAGRIQDLPLPE